MGDSYEEVEYVFNIPDGGLQDREYTLKISDENTDKKLFKFNGRDFSHIDGYVPGYQVRFTDMNHRGRGFEYVQPTIAEEENHTIKLKIEPDLGEVGDGVANDIEPMGGRRWGVIEQAGVEVSDDGDVIENEENELTRIYGDLQRLVDEGEVYQNAGRSAEREMREMLETSSLGREMTGGNKKHKSHRRKSHNKSKKKRSKKKRSRKKTKKR